MFNNLNFLVYLLNVYLYSYCIFNLFILYIKQNNNNNYTK